MTANLTSPLAPCPTCDKGRHASFECTVDGVPAVLCGACALLIGDPESVLPSTAGRPSDGCRACTNDDGPLVEIAMGVLVYRVCERCAPLTRQAVAA